MKYKCLNLVLGKYILRYRNVNDNNQLGIFKDKNHLINCIAGWNRDRDYWLSANIHNDASIEDFELIEIDEKEVRENS